MFHGQLDNFGNPPFGGRPNTKPGDHGPPNAHKHWFILFYQVWGPARIERHWDSIWLRVRSHMASHYLRVRDHVAWCGRCLGRPLDTFFCALTIFMVKTLGSCVKRPLGIITLFTFNWEFWWTREYVREKILDNFKAMHRPVDSSTTCWQV